MATVPGGAPSVTPEVQAEMVEALRPYGIGSSPTLGRRADVSPRMRTPPTP